MHPLSKLILILYVDFHIFDRDWIWGGVISTRSTKHSQTRSTDAGGPCCSVGGGVQQSSALQQAEREGGAPPEVEALHPALQDPSGRECGAVQLGVGNSTFTSLKTNNTTDVIAAHPVIATAVIRRNLRVFILVKQ
jgi:hypothetical protein